MTILTENQHINFDAFLRQNGSFIFHQRERTRKPNIKSSIKKIRL